MRLLAMHVFASCLLFSACDGGAAAPDGGISDGGRITRRDSGPSCTPSGATETSCTGGVDEDCDDRIDCADSDCGGMSCGAEGFMCAGGGCIREGVLPELPEMTNVRAVVTGASAEITFDPVEGARDYRVYVFPDEADVTARSDGYLTVRDATYRCAGNRMTIDASWRDHGDAPGGSAVHTIVDGAVDGYTRTPEQATLGHVWTAPGEGRVPVHALSDPSAGSDNNPGCYAMRWYESRSKRYITAESERSSLVADGWRDDGVAFYVPASESAQTTTVFTRTNGQARYYYAEGPEADAREDGIAAFEVLSAPSSDTQPLMRVHYWQACAPGHHDELMAGRPRFERAYYQGSQLPHTGLHWAGLRGETTLVIEALADLCPWPNAHVAPVTASEGDTPPWRTVDDLRADSPTGEVYVNGQGEPTNEPIPIARSFVTLRPADAPALDWSYGWTAEPAFGDAQEESCLADNAADCGGSHWFRTPNAVFELNGVHEPWNGWREQLGELWVALRDQSNGAKFRLFPTVQGRMSADSFLYVTMSVDALTTGRRYPQIMIADSTISYPVAQNLAGGDALIVQTFAYWPNAYLLSVCDDHAWEVNAQCSTYADSRWALDPENPDPRSPVAIRPVIDAYEQMDSLDQWVRFEVYASTERAYLFLDGHPYGCMDLPSDGVPSGEVNLAFGNVMYHAGAETTHSDFMNSHDHGAAFRHYGNLGFRSDVPEPEWDEERFPCSPASWMFPL